VSSKSSRSSVALPGSGASFPRIVSAMQCCSMLGRDPVVSKNASESFFAKSTEEKERLTKLLAKHA
jgi:hypothetical protein